jgi:hypothetical protein
MRSWLIVLMCACATVTIAAEDTSSSAAAATAPIVAKGKMLMGASGSHLGVVNRVTADGNPQIIIDGKLVTIPASTLSTVDGKLTTSLSKSEVLALH